MRKLRILGSPAAVLVLGGAWAIQQAGAQPVPPLGIAQLPPFFAQRELNAPLAVRNRLTVLRAQVAASGRSFNVAYTGVFDLPLAQVAGATPPRDLARRAPALNALNNQLLRVDREVAAKIRDLTEVQLKPSAKLKSFDWRSLGKITPIRNQNPYGTC